MFQYQIHMFLKHFFFALNLFQIFFTKLKDIILLK